MGVGSDGRDPRAAGAPRPPRWGMGGWEQSSPFPLQMECTLGSGCGGWGRLWGAGVSLAQRPRRRLPAAPGAGLMRPVPAARSEEETSLTGDNDRRAPRTGPGARGAAGRSGSPGLTPDYPRWD